jgi:hypothetical protein
MARSHAFVADLAQWIDELKNRSEVAVLQAGAREYQFSIVSLSFGQYRAAFAALRLSLELLLAGVLWSTNERELREWKRGLRDSNWAGLIDGDNGVLSKQFVRLFSEPLADEAPIYRGLAITLYRECSEYVHGNAHTHTELSEKIIFDGDTFEAWHKRASSMRLVISFALAARYLSDLEELGRANLETMVLDRLGHSMGVRLILGAPVELLDG